MRTRALGISVVVVMGGLLIWACGGGDNGSGPTPTKPYNEVTLSFFEAAPLSQGLAYQLWARPKSGTLAAAAATSAWHSLVRFNLSTLDTTMVTEEGSAIPENTLADLPVDLADFDSVFVTIEPSPDSDTLPSTSVYLRGKIVLPTLRITSLEFPMATLQNLHDSASLFTFATPTDGDTTDELSGVWFMNAGGQQGLQGADALPAGWVYEGWAVHDGYTLSTGRFVDAVHADSGNPYSGFLTAPHYPGEDFLRNSPYPQLTFPFHFASGDDVMITVEPSPDPDRAHAFPFVIFTAAAGTEPDVFRNFFLDAHPEAVPAAQILFTQATD